MTSSFFFLFQDYEDIKWKGGLIRWKRTRKKVDYG